MEKNGNIVLTEEDIELFNNGKVSERIQNYWGLSLSELAEIIRQGNFTIIPKK